jgi:hypothetical protein
MEKCKGILITIILGICLVSSCNALERHLMLFAPLSDGNQTIIFEVLSTGKILDTGQRLNTGYTWYSDASPDGQTILIPNSGQIMHFHIAPTGSVSLITTYPYGTDRIAYHPNGQMVISTYTTIFRVNETGLLEVTNYYSRGAGTLWISPLGNIMVSSEVSSNIGVYRIDTTNFTMTTTQLIYINGGAQDAVYTPDGSQVLVAAYTNYAANQDVHIFQVTPDGMVVESTEQHLDIPNLDGAKSIVMSSDGQYAFVGMNASNGFIATLGRTPTGQWYDTGKRVALDGIWQMIMSPAYHLLVVHHEIGFYKYISTFFVNSDGTLVPTGYNFPFQQTFGTAPIGMVLAYPPGVTEVESAQWQLYE